MQKLTLTMADIKEDLFWSHVDKSGACWQWTAGLADGYGRVHISRGVVRRTFRAHRASWHLTGREIPEGMFLDHICQNRGCVNPAHLRIVNMKQNMEHRTGAQSNAKSGIRGVSWCKRAKSWRVDVRHHGKSFYGGRFADITVAERKAVAIRNELFTHNNLDRVEH